MSYPQDEKYPGEVIDIHDHKLKTEIVSKTASFASSEDTFDIEGYVPELQWTEEEERKVVNAIDIKLMPFVLLMTFVLNMDRTNNCKYYNKKSLIWSHLY